jgi:hypothetical protein
MPMTRPSAIATKQPPGQAPWPRDLPDRRRRLPVRRMHAGVVSGAAGVEDSGTPDPDSPSDAALPDRDVGAAHADAQARPGE